MTPHAVGVPSGSTTSAISRTHHGTVTQPRSPSRRWSACHRKTAIVGWLAFVIAAVVLGGAAGIDYQREEDLGTGESGRADKIIAAGFADYADEQVLVQSRGSVRFDDPRFGAALDDVERRLAGVPFVADIESPRAHGASLV